MSILLTGATGFVGKALALQLVAMGCLPVVGTIRFPGEMLAGVTPFPLRGIDAETDWCRGLQGIDTVIHLAARVHVMDDTTANPLEEYRRVNTAGTLNLARQAATVGVKRFVFISSIKVNGEETRRNHPYTENDIPAPQDPYGISKYEAEDGLRLLALETGMEVVIIRPPLVYGPEVKGNFQQLIYWVGKGLPLPFGSIYNKRSLVALDNLVDLIITCLMHPAAANQTFLVGDGYDISTTELFQRVALAMGKSSRLIPMPVFFLKSAAALLGKRAMMLRLCCSLQVDISKARNVLGWMPPVTVDEGLRRAVS